MSTYYLDFEKPVKDLDNQILELESSQDPNQADLKKLIKLQEKTNRCNRKDIFGALAMATRSVGPTSQSTLFIGLFSILFTGFR